MLLLNRLGNKDFNPNYNYFSASASIIYMVDACNLGVNEIQVK